VRFVPRHGKAQGKGLRRAHKVDGNQALIVKALRKAGATVAITSAVGDGFPDLVVGFRGLNYLLELKDSGQPPSKRHLTPEQGKFFEKWKGEAYVAETVEQALRSIGVGD